MSLQNLEDALNVLKTELARIPPATQQLESSRESIKQGITVLETLSGHVNGMAGVVGKVGESIARVDFVSRLDKVDSTISSVNLAMQNMQADTRALEARLLDKFASEHAKIDEKLEKGIGAARRVNIVLGIFLFLSVLGLIVLTVLARLK